MTQSRSGEEQIGIGMHVVIEMRSADGGNERMAFDIVPEHAADYGAGFVGANTPLAKAIRGKFAGATVPYNIGDIVEIQIVDVAPAEPSSPDDSVARRQAAYDETLRKAERTNAEMFASSYGSKWGGYEMDEGA